jgi:hypothetical protein
LPEERRGRDVFRSRFIIAQEAAITLILAFVGFGIAAAAAPAPGGELILVIGIFFTLFALRNAFRIAVVMDDSGVVVRNFWRAYDVSWQEITSVQDSWIVIGPLPTRTLGLACERNRRVVRVLASADSNRSRRELARQLGERPELAHARFDLRGTIQPPDTARAG